MSNFMQKLRGSSTPATPLVNPIQDELNRLLGQATQLASYGQHRAAYDLYQQGVQLARSHGETRAEQFFLSGLGKTLADLKQYEESESNLRQALNLAKHLDDKALLARSLNNLGELYAEQKDWVKAQTQHEQALEEARLSQDTGTIILALESLARDYKEQKNPSYALHLLKEALNYSRQMNQPHIAATTLGKLGETAFLTEERHSARGYLERALLMSQQIGNYPQAIRWQRALTRIDLEEGRYAAALPRLLQAQDTARQIGYQVPAVFLEIALDLALIYLQMGNYTEAQTEAERAFMHAKELGDEVARAKALGWIGLAHQGKGNYAEAKTSLQEALAAYENGLLSEEATHTRLLLALGRTQQELGEADAARTIFAEVLRRAQDSGDEKRHAEALKQLGHIALDRAEAMRYWQDALQRFDSAGEKVEVARLLCDIGNLRRQNGDFQGAMTDFENALVRLSGINDRVTRGLVLSNAANLYTETGDIDTARSFYQEAIDIAQSTHDAAAMSLRIGNMGWFYVLTGQYDLGITTLEKAIGISRDLKQTLQLAIQTANIGWAYYRKADLPSARNLFNQAQHLIESTTFERWQAFIKSSAALVLLDAGLPDEALTQIQMALALAEKVQENELLITVKARAGEVYLRRGDTAMAEMLGQDAEALARRIGYRRGQGEALHLLGDIAQKQGDGAKARPLYEQAYRHYQVLHDPRAEGIKQFI